MGKRRFFEFFLNFWLAGAGLTHSELAPRRENLNFTSPTSVRRVGIDIPAGLRSIFFDFFSVRGEVLSCFSKHFDIFGKFVIFRQNVRI